MVASEVDMDIRPPATSPAVKDHRTILDMRAALMIATLPASDMVVWILSVMAETTLAVVR
jgi:hypothetical protein